MSTFVVSKETVVRCNITSVRFQVLNDRSRGRMVVRFEVFFKSGDAEPTSPGIKAQRITQPEERKAFMASAFIDCLWPDAKNNAIKAYMTVNTENRALMVLVKICQIFKTISCPDDMQLSCAGGSLRYGPAAGRQHVLTGDDYISISYYNSVSESLAAIVKQIKTYKPVLGIAGINLGLVEPSVLQEIGFEKIPDILGRGPDMWAGDPGKFLEAREGYKDSTFDAATKNGVYLLDAIKKSLSRLEDVNTVNPPQSEQPLQSA